MKNSKESTKRSASKHSLCGAIFDAPSKKAELAKTEEQVAAPDFWNQPEQSQKVMQERKRIEQALADEEELARKVSDLDTLLELGREGEPVTAEIGRETGLHFVYAGNLPGMTGDLENTYCPACHELLIARQGFVVRKKTLRNGMCPNCARPVPGIWS